MPIETTGEGLDLLALRAAGRSVQAAAARIRAEALRARLGEALAAQPPALRDLLDRLIDEVGGIAAEAEAAHQAATEGRRERGAWLRIDPLRHIPEERGDAILPPPARFEVSAADPDFVGFGWYAAEGRGAESRRWSGTAPAASIVIPDLGPGTIEIELKLELPFGEPFRPDSVGVLANGEPLDVVLREADANRATLALTWDGFEAAGANLGLVLLGPLLSDPLGRDSRRLGVGVWHVRAARAGLGA